ncbi:MAG TPA: cytidine deaminase [Candidatus Sulfotelmatobacter sp.]|nr:cytidine deaminase [Candidatus Sulfotelmatobacter sp.]
MSLRDTEISRRKALVALGTSALGLAMKGVPMFAEAAWSERLQKLLPQFSGSSRSLLDTLLKDPAYSGRIPAKETATLAANENTTVEKLMVALIPLAQSYSRAPISNFYVGVVVRGASGSLYTGANIEIPGQCLGFAVHAEQSALSNAYMHGEESVTALAVGGAPCGHCRQFIDEMSPDGEIVILTPQQGPRKLSQILPEAFGPAALGMKHGAFPVPTTNLAPGGTSVGPEVMAALEAARRSYAPYSKSPSGVALRSTSGRMYRGSYIESVAFNPSLSPLQVALAALIAGGEDYSRIVAAALVEAKDAKISQRPVTETVLRAIAPSVKLIYSAPSSY